MELVLTDSGVDSPSESRPAHLIMEPEPIPIAPEAATLDAMQLMRRRGVSCPPVAYHLLEDRLHQDPEEEPAK